MASGQCFSAWFVAHQPPNCWGSFFKVQIPGPNLPGQTLQVCSGGLRGTAFYFILFFCLLFEMESRYVTQAGVRWHNLAYCSLHLPGSSHSSASAS